MKEASGEFSMTLIVIIGAIIIVGILTTFLKPEATPPKKMPPMIRLCCRIR